MLFNFLWNFTAFIISTSILITIHEFGHFIAARYYGVKIKSFSVGFGYPLYRFKDKYDTEYIIAAIPLGGYIKMDETINDINSNNQNKIFHHKSIWQRTIIIASGPILNILFAVFIYWLLFLIGISSYKPIINAIIPQSIADKAHILPGMELKSIDGINTDDWDTVRMQLFNKIGIQKITFNMILFNPVINKNVVLDLHNWQFNPDKEDPVISLGIIPLTSTVKPILTKIQLNSPAMQSGLQVGDEIIKVNGNLIEKWSDFIKIIHNNPNKILNLIIKRNGNIKIINVKPNVKIIKHGYIIGYIGVTPKIIPISNAYKVIQKYNPLMAFIHAVNKIWQLICFTINMLNKLIIGNIHLNNISGPISIAQGAGAAAKYGVISYLMFVALISLNLGIINLLPLPILDGGHLLFLIIEKLIVRSKFEKIQRTSYYISFIILIIIMLLSILNDLFRLYS